MHLYAVHARCASCWVTWAGQLCMEAPRSVQCPAAGALTGLCHARVCMTLNPRVKPNAVKSVYHRGVTRRWTSSNVRATSDTATDVAGLLAGLEGYDAQRACSRNWPHVSTGFRPKWSRASLSTVSRKRASVLPCSCPGAQTRALVCSHFLVSAYLQNQQLVHLEGEVLIYCSRAAYGAMQHTGTHALLPPRVKSDLQLQVSRKSALRERLTSAVCPHLGHILDSAFPHLIAAGRNVQRYVPAESQQHIVDYWQDGRRVSRAQPARATIH